MQRYKRSVIWDYRRSILRDYDCQSVWIRKIRNKEIRLDSSRWFCWESCIWISQCRIYDDELHAAGKHWSAHCSLVWRLSSDFGVRWLVIRWFSVFHSVFYFSSNEFVVIFLCCWSHNFNYGCPRENLRDDGVWPCYQNHNWKRNEDSSRSSEIRESQVQLPWRIECLSPPWNRLWDKIWPMCCFCGYIWQWEKYSCETHREILWHY